MSEKNTCLIIKTVTISLRHRLGGFLFLIVTICQTGAPQNPQNLFGRFSQYSQNVNVFGYQKSWKGVCALSHGIAPNVVMKWTGLSDYKAMRPYIDIVDSIRAQEMTKMDFID